MPNYAKLQDDGTYKFQGKFYRIEPDGTCGAQGFNEPEQALASSGTPVATATEEVDSTSSDE